MPRPTRTRSKWVSGRDSVAGVFARCRTSGSTPASSATASSRSRSCVDAGLFTGNHDTLVYVHRRSAVVERARADVDYVTIHGLADRVSERCARRGRAVTSIDAANCHQARRGKGRKWNQEAENRYGTNPPSHTHLRRSISLREV